MTNVQRHEYLLRNGIMKLLSDEEVARVSTAESAIQLADGEEYLDLEQLSEGVRRAQFTPTPMGRVLPKSAVHQETWNRIVEQLAMPFLADREKSESRVTPRST